MKVAFLIGEEALRKKLAKCIGPDNLTLEEYPTATKALTAFSSEQYDLIVIHWKVYPGFGSGDPRIDELAELIPNIELNANVFYWEVGLRVIDAIRAEDTPNQATPVIAIFPDLGRAGFGAGDELNRESIESDIASRQPAEAIYGSSEADFTNAVTRATHIERKRQ